MMDKCKCDTQQLDDVCLNFMEVFRDDGQGVYNLFHVLHSCILKLKCEKNLLVAEKV